MAGGIGIGVDAGELSRAKRTLAQIRSESNKALNKAAKLGAHRFRKQLLSNLRDGGKVAKIAPGTKRKRRVGKLAGKSPAIPRYAGNRPLIRSKATMRAIRVKRQGHAHYQIDVNPTAQGSQGQNLAVAAANQERGMTVTVQLTTRMMRYLRVLYKRTGATPGGKSGRHRRHSASDRVIRAMTIRVPPRPIWRITFDEIHKIFENEFPKDFWKNTGLGIEFFS